MNFTQVAGIADGLMQVVKAVEPEFRAAIECGSAVRAGHQLLIDGVGLNVLAHVAGESMYTHHERCVDVAPIGMELLRAHARLAPEHAHEFDHPLCSANGRAGAGSV